MKIHYITLLICMYCAVSFGQDNIKIEITKKEQIHFIYSESLKQIDSILRVQTQQIPKYNLFLEVNKEGNSRVLLISVDKEGTSDYLYGLNGVDQLRLELLFNESEVSYDKTLILPFRSRFKIVLE